METTSVHSLNEKYYNNLYKERNKVLNIIYPLISYDQQSKSKANYFFVRNLINPEDCKVLDYGFGHGSFLLKFPKRCTLYGVDISEEAVINFPKTAKSFGRQAFNVTGSGWKFPAPLKNFFSEFAPGNVLFG